MAEAEFEATRLDAQGVDWSVYALHPNPYVRGLALVRLRSQAGTATDAQLQRVAGALFDTGLLLTKHCVELLENREPGQGIDLARGQCFRNAQTVATLAGKVLDEVEPARVVEAIMATLAEPGLRVFTGDAPLWPAIGDRLRATAAKAPAALTSAAARWLPESRRSPRRALLAALSAAPLGSADEATLALVVPLLQAEDTQEAVLAAAAILRLTDNPGPQAAPVNADPRKGATQLLTVMLSEGRSLSQIASIGPAASVLLDPMLAQMERYMSEEHQQGTVIRYAQLVGAIGPRAHRASATLLRAGRRIASGERTRAFHVIVTALGEIQAPSEELRKFVLPRLDNRETVGASTRALLALKARLTPSELAELKRGVDEHCTIPNHPRVFDGAWDVCFAARADFEELKKLANSDPQ